MKVIVAALLIFGAGACTPAAQQKLAQAERDKDLASCQSIGAVTQQQMFQCRLTLENQRRNAIAMSDAAEDGVAAANRQAVVNSLIYGRR